MLKISLQFFGGRGGGGSGGARGGKRASKAPVKGSASNPVTSGELDKMSATDRVSALNAMPEGTKVRIYNTRYPGSPPESFVKKETGWDREFTTKEVGRYGKFVDKKSYVPVDISHFASHIVAGKERVEFRSVRYPKKKG